MKEKNLDLKLAILKFDKKLDDLKLSLKELEKIINYKENLDYKENEKK